MKKLIRSTYSSFALNPLVSIYHFFKKRPLLNVNFSPLQHYLLFIPLLTLFPAQSPSLHSQEGSLDLHLDVPLKTEMTIEVPQSKFSVLIDDAFGNPLSNDWTTPLGNIHLSYNGADPFVITAETEVKAPGALDQLVLKKQGRDVFLPFKLTVGNTRIETQQGALYTYEPRNAPLENKQLSLGLLLPQEELKTLEAGNFFASILISLHTNS